MIELTRSGCPIELWCFTICAFQDLPLILAPMRAMQKSLSDIHDLHEYRACSYLFHFQRSLLAFLIHLVSNVPKNTGGENRLIFS